MRQRLEQAWGRCQPLRAVARAIASAGVVLQFGCGDAPSLPIRLMTYNVGTPGRDDPRYAYRIAERAYEDCLGERIRAMAPDVVLLQEVLPPGQCAEFVESDPARTCWNAAGREPAVRRLLGPGYTIACDARRHLECVGVARSFGSIEGLATGGLGLGAAETPALPLPACVYPEGDCDEGRCDGESTVSAVTVATRRGQLRIVHVHASAPGTSAAGVFWGTACRSRQLRQVFEGLPGFGDAPLVTVAATVVAGDFNLDPVRLIGAASRRVWARHVGPGRRFRDLTPRTPDGTQYGTRRGNLGLAADHVLVDRLGGACAVHGHGIGPDPGTAPLDAGCVAGERVDHFAITCELVWPGEWSARARSRR